MKLRWLSSVLLPAIAVTGALWLTHREIQGYSLAQLETLLFSFSTPVLLTALALTFAGYWVLALYDWIALRHVERKLPVWQAMLAGFISFAVSNSAGHAMVSGGSLRYRFYSGWGLGGLEIAQVILLSTITYFLANGTLLASSYLFTPADFFADRHLAGGYLHLVMWMVMLLLGIYWALVLSGKRTINWREYSITLPGPQITLMQSVLGVTDVLLAAAVLYVLLSQHITIAFGVFLNAYLLAQVIGLFSQSPGGIGVFEGVFLYLLTGVQPSAEVLACLLAYRAIYYFLPLLVACALIIAHEFWVKDALRKKVMTPWVLLRQELPFIFSLLMLIGGAMLLLSGTTPGETNRLDWLGDILPVTLIETSHLIASLTGLLILVLARAIRMKLRAAYVSALVLLAIGIAASLFKGGDFEEASVLAMFMLLLLPAKESFYRTSRIEDVQMTPQWLLLIIAVLGLAIWLGFISYREVEYSHDLWWTFNLHGDAPRFLRSTLALVSMLFTILGFFFLRRSRYQPHLPDVEELEQAAALARQSNDSNHFLALTGDKCLFWNESRTAFVSYVDTRKYWIVMNDPCCAAELRDELLWQFREAADRFGSKLVFYRVRSELLPLYLDLGLTLVKLGEEAVVNLNSFSLSGSSRASLRHAYNKMQKDGYTFSVVPRTAVANIIESLQVISDDWLQTKNTREKGISLGFFDRDYLQRTDIALISRNGVTIAFANLWRPDNPQEMSIDLMRYSSAAPNGTMEYLTICLMLWAKDKGYTGFNLGMAPLSGLENHALAPLWHKIGNSIFHYGNEFYNFQGLRAYKNKFSPTWSPRYLAVPSTLDVPEVLLQVTSLIAGGMKGIFGK